VLERLHVPQDHLDHLAPLPEDVPLLVLVPAPALVPDHLSVPRLQPKDNIIVPVLHQDVPDPAPETALLPETVVTITAIVPDLRTAALARDLRNDGSPLSVQEISIMMPVEPNPTIPIAIGHQLLTIVPRTVGMLLT